MKNWFVLFVRAGSEVKLTSTLRGSLNATDYFPFLPLRVVSYRKKKVVYRVRRLLFPGYIFVQTQIEPVLIADSFRLVLEGIKEKKIYSILHYGNDKNDVVVREEERLHWERLFNEEFCIEESIGFAERDVIRVTSGPLIGLEGKIKRVNRHKREATVEMHMMGAIHEVSLMLEITEKIDKE